MGAVGILLGWNLFLLEPRRDTLEILQMTKIHLQMLEHWLSCHVKFLSLLQNV